MCNLRCYCPVLLVLLLVCGPLLVFSACSESRESAVEGVVLDWNDAPVAKAKVVATQLQPIKGYEQVETVTRQDGTFRLSGLYPSSGYILRPVSDKWTTRSDLDVQTPPQGETGLLAPLKIDVAFVQGSGAVVADLATGASRFTVSSVGVITDTETSFEWILVPNPKSMDYDEGLRWVEACSIAGGGWRLPTRRQLSTLYDPKTNGNIENKDPVFRATDREPWAEPQGSSRRWVYDFLAGSGQWSGPRSSRTRYPQLAVRVPSTQFTTSVEEAKAKILRVNLSRLRNAINLYYHEHGSKNPGVVKIDGTGVNTASGDNPDAFVKQLTQYTNGHGQTSAAKDMTNFPYGPYLQAIPENPSNNLTNVQVLDTTSCIVVGDVTGTAGWVYSKQTGEIRAHDNLAF